MSSKSLVWFITGCSVGLGRHLAKEALRRNDRVIATARSTGTIKDLESENCKILQLDVTQPMEVVQNVVAKAEESFGAVDVLVNNAGAIIPGITEELGPESYRKQFETNFFGPLKVTNAFLPYMRNRRQGTAIFVGSRSSFRTSVPGLSPYSSSKAALTAAVEAMATEVQSFNIQMLNVLPGALRTSVWSAFSKNNQMASFSRSSPLRGHIRGIADYSSLNEKLLKWGENQHAQQMGDPRLAAKAIVDFVHDLEDGMKALPTLGMLALGEDAGRDIREKCNKVLQNLDETLSVTHSIKSK